MHVHVTCADGEAKYGLDPEVELATSVGLSRPQLNEIRKLVEKHGDDFKKAWRKHFEG